MKLRNFLVGLAIWAGTHEASAQGGWMIHLDSVQHPAGSSIAHGGNGRSIREMTGGGYLLFSTQSSPSTPAPHKTHSFNRILSTAGQLISELEFGSDSLNQNYGYIDPIADHPGGGYVAFVSDFFGFHQRGSLYRFDEFGDTLWTNELFRYAVADSIIAFARDIAVLADGGYIMGGTYDPQDASALGYLIRADANGDTLWTRRYPNNIAWQVLGVEEYHDGGYLLTGYRTGNMNVVFLMRTDTLGNTIWTRYMGNRGDANAAVRMTADSNIVTLCNYREQAWPTNYYQYMLTKWNGAGNLVWQRRSHQGWLSSTLDLEELGDGTFICSAARGGAAIIQKFSSAGDSLWHRHYVWFQNSHQLYDIEPTADGGFIATGSSFQNTGDPTPGLETIIVLKTDSFGCVVPGCHTVGVQEYELSLNEQLRIWPNPVAAGGTVQVQMELPEGYPITGPVRLVVMDAVGRTVSEEKVTPSGNLLSHSFTLSPHSPGLYFLHLADEKRWLAGGKVMVE